MSGDYARKLEEVIDIQVAIVHDDGSKRVGKHSHITIPAKREINVGDVRDYILKCATGEEGKEEDQKEINKLILESGVELKDITENPIEVVHPHMEDFKEDQIPECPVSEGTVVFFLHPKPIG